MQAASAPRDASRPSAPSAGERGEAVSSVDRTALPARRSLLYTHRAQMSFWCQHNLCFLLLSVGVHQHLQKILSCGTLIDGMGS